VTTSPHRLIHASAGTGKTYELSGRYLALLFAGVDPRSILATTFTRKAAGEIQDRVLERLARAALEPARKQELESQLGYTLAQGQIVDLLARLTRRLDHMRVRTLDAFFVHLAKLFALELGLPPEWSIVDDADERALRRESVARTLARTAPEELLVLLRGLQRSEASRSVEATLLREIEHGRNAFLESRAEAWSVVRPPLGPDERELSAALRAVEQARPPRKEDGSPDRNWEKELPLLRARVAAGDWQELLAKGLGKKVAAGETTYQRREIPPELCAALEALVREAAHNIVGEVVRFNSSAQTWLERFETAFEEVKAEERSYRFEDLPKALHPREESRLGVLEDLWYRLDGRLDHLLLDEFQDTAPVQWRILAPLASEILADGTGTRSFFCVGDLKQSIYGFREAEPRLLAGMERSFAVLQHETLTRSYRSSQVVLDTVNQVFRRLGDNPAFQSDEHLQAARAFEADFTPHVAARDLPGAAVLLEAPPTDGEGREAGEFAVLVLAAERAQALKRVAPEATIGILLRRNKHIARLILLLRERGLFASGEGGNPLTDSAAVLHHLSLLHLADHPGDSMAAFHLASSPLAAELGLTREGYLRERGPLAERVRKELAHAGHGALAARMLPAVDAGYGPWDRRRFRQLVDLAHAHDERATLRADRFVDQVRLTRVEDPAATDVQVMTVHSAKGLEFDAVLLPELDGPFLSQRAELLTERPDPAGLITAVSRAPAEDVCRMESTLDALWKARETRELREAMCLLYVAMTRARHRLEMLVQHRDKPEVSRSCAGLLRAALGATRARRGILWASGPEEAPWFTPRASRASSPPPGAPRPAPFRPSQVRVLPTRTPSASEGNGRRRAQELLASPRTPARLAGDLAHRWLACVSWLEEGLPPEAELLEMGRALTDDDELLARSLAELRGFLAQPVTRGALTRSGAGPCEVWRERSFALVLAEPDGSSALWSGAFDRVVLSGAPGHWTSARILDFKTDRVTSASLAERAEHYRPQLDGYRRVLAAMTGLAEARVEAELLFLRADALLPVPHRS